MAMVLGPCMPIGKVCLAYVRQFTICHQQLALVSWYAAISGGWVDWNVGSCRVLGKFLGHDCRMRVLPCS
jgi:hypothetical protein